MRKRHIKSVAHWIIMCFILLFPIVMVGISSFSATQQEIHVTESYEYQTNEVNDVDDLVVGNIYHFTSGTNITIYNVVEDGNFGDVYFFNLELSNYEYINIDESFVEYLINQNSLYVNEDTIYLYYYESIGNTLSLYSCWIVENSTPFECDLIMTQELKVCIEDYINHYEPNVQYSDLDFFSASDYLGEHTIDYNITDQTMRDDVNDWCASFRNLPVNQWYGDMLDTIGLGITTSMMMNVIYTYPLYVLWVYIIDLLVDCLLVIINFGHNALKRLGGENE